VKIFWDGHSPPRAVQPMLVIISTNSDLRFCLLLGATASGVRDISEKRSFRNLVFISLSIVYNLQIMYFLFHHQTLFQNETVFSLEKILLDSSQRITI
jgi:hypothetical protein